MSDERDKLELEGAGAEAVVPAPEATPVVDPWAEAFAAVAPEAPADAAVAAPEPAGAAAVAEGEPAPATGAGDAQLGAGDAGGPVPPAGPADESGGAGAVPDVEAVVATYTAEIEQRAITETAQMFLDRADDQGRKLIRQSNGQIGATINDPDIYRVDPQTGAAAFYNPDTGRPFTGDNPRAQAKAWVEAYNDELRDTFNRIAAARQVEIESEMAPVINLVKFAPTYEKLDPVRQRMFDALIEGYEVNNAQGEHIGYSIDLDQALERVNRQVAAIQASRQAQQQAPTPEPKVPTGPAVDMPTSGSSGGVPGKQITSLAEAMEAMQDAELEKKRR